MQRMTTGNRRKTGDETHGRPSWNPSDPQGRDRWGGILMALLGLGAITRGHAYEIGNLQQMGPGFFPVAVGAGLLIIGVALFIRASRQPFAVAATGAANPATGPTTAAGAATAGNAVTAANASNASASAAAAADASDTSALTAASAYPLVSNMASMVAPGDPPADAVQKAPTSADTAGIATKAGASRTAILSRMPRITLPFDGRGCAFVMLGMIAFIALGQYGGLGPATFALVFISAMGDRGNSIRDAVLLALAMVIIAIAIFWWALKVPFPIFQWS